MKKEIEFYFQYVSGRRKGLKNLHDGLLPRINACAGSTGNHQNWEGGYRDHIEQMLHVADRLALQFSRLLPFSFESVVLAIYFHDIEKLHYDQEKFEKTFFLTETLPQFYGFSLTEWELNAVRYAHGEGYEYRKDQRVMNELAGFVHACDVMSARVFHDQRDISEPIQH